MSGNYKPRISKLLDFYKDSDSQILDTDLTGFSVGSNVAIATSDSILSAFGKTQGQINARISYSSQNYTSVNANGSATTNGTALSTALTAAKALTPNGAALSNTNRSALILFPGKYDLGSGSISLGQYTDIYGIGSAKDVVITSSNSTGTIQIANSNNYVLRNITVVNTGSGGSITHNSGQTDNGIWDKIVVVGPNTQNTIFNGIYDGITGTVNNVLNGSITGIVSNALFQSNSCGYGTADTTISGIINNSIGINNCFGYVTSGTLTFSGQMQETSAQNTSFGASLGGNVVISGIMTNCRGISECFGSTATTTGGSVTISGRITNCFVTDDKSFGYSGNSAVSISGLIENCSATTDSFASGMSTVELTITGRIFSCQSGARSFLYSSNNNVVISGAVSSCKSLADECFGYSAATGGVTLDGTGSITYCIGNHRCFISAVDGPVLLQGLLSDLTGGNLCFGVSTGNDVTIDTEASIQNCTGLNSCYGVSGTADSVAGKITNCRGTTNCLGSTTTDAVIKRFSRTGTLGRTYLGLFYDCTFYDDSTGSSIYLGDGAKMYYCTVVQNNGSGNTIGSLTGAITVSLGHLSLNKATTVDITNSIAVPCNVVDSNVSL